MPLNRHRAKRLVCRHTFRDHSAVADKLKSALDEFVRFAQTLRGDEKSEAQTFLEHFFRALGHEGVIEAGATFEFHVALELNLACAVKEKSGERITPPGLSLPQGECAGFCYRRLHSSAVSLTRC
jgi:hypothetical protein